MVAAREGRRNKTRQVVAATAAAVVLVVGGGVVASQAVLGGSGNSSTDVAADPGQLDECDGAAVSKRPDPVPQGPDYPTNANGLTYGGAPDGRTSPDLLAVVGDCGRTGYVYATDLNEQEPWVPGAGDGSPRTVKVWASDGVTQVDTFTTQRGVPGPGGESSGEESGEGDAASAGPDGADLQGEWSAIIAGITNEDGSSQFDTFRDVDLTVRFEGDRVRVWDGCQDWEAGFASGDGEFVLTSEFDAVTSKAASCDRAAPLVDVLENVRRVSRTGGRVYLHLASGQIVLALRQPS